MPLNFWTMLACAVALTGAPLNHARAQSARPATGIAPLGIALPPPAPGIQCRQAIHAAERTAAIPMQLMAAIARVESGRPDGQGAIHPWPWTINAEGAGQYFASKDAALAAVRALQARGVRSIDVGCMQVNLHHHPAAFATLDQAFDPATNAAYAARYLNVLYAATRDWTRATASYHSATPDLGEAYQRRVAAVWPEEQRRGGTGLGLHQANAQSVHAMTTHAFTRNAWNTAGAPHRSLLGQSGRPIMAGAAPDISARTVNTASLVKSPSSP